MHVRQPEGPEYNNPDYSDPEYEVGPKTSQDYLDKNPITPEDREFLRNAREDWSDAEVLSDPELLGVSRLSTTDVSVLNPAMRTGDQTVLDEWDAQIRATVSGLNKLKPYVGKTARGIHVPSDEMGPFLDRYTKGNIVEEPSFTHSSMSRPYLRNRNVVFLIDSTGGRDISALQPGLQEVVFPPGEQFTVKDAYYNEADHRWYIKLQDSGRGEPDGRP